jgi:hypothetical protein
MDDPYLYRRDRDTKEESKKHRGRYGQMNTSLYSRNAAAYNDSALEHMTFDNVTKLQVDDKSLNNRVRDTFKESSSKEREIVVKESNESVDNMFFGEK